MTLVEFGGVPVLVCTPGGPPLAGPQDALDVIGDALGAAVAWVAVPVARLAPDFFVLRTRLAGEIVQKFVNYRLNLAIVGDVAAHVAASDALRDFVREANRGRHLWFVADLDELGTRLTGRPGSLEQ